MQIPLAFIGFGITGIFFWIYSYTFYSLLAKKIVLLKNFAYAYFSLSLAFLVWGIATLVGNQNILNLSVIIGNIFLLVATLFLLKIKLHESRSLKDIGLKMGIVISLILLLLRIVYFPPKPILSDGILIFNTDLPVAFILGLIILLIWLPTNIKVAKIVTEKLKIQEVSFIYSSIYIMATIATLIFISARTIPVIILSFTSIAICFAMLIVSNIVVDKSKYGSNK